MRIIDCIVVVLTCSVLYNMYVGGAHKKKVAGRNTNVNTRTIFVFANK